MKKAPSALYLLFAASLMVSNGFAQTDRREANKSPAGNLAAETDNTVRTSRVIGSAKASNHAVSTAEVRRPPLQTLAATTLPNSGGSDGLTNDGSKRSASPVWGNAPVQPDLPDLNRPLNKDLAGTAAGSPSATLTKMYRVGIGDVLDIRLLNTPTRESTLFTVLPGGVIEYPLIDQPLKVEGLSPEEIGARLTRGIKVIDHPRISVSVRDHSSHNVIVTGLVYNPGAKVLRQEAVPLYVVLAEAVARAGAARATITRSSGQTTVVDLADQEATSTLLMNGDLVKVSSALPQYFYVYGEINSPGEKTFRAGLTLTQSILASGGITQNASSKVRLISQGAGGVASTRVEYNVREILEGRKPDPTIKPGDRLEVIRGRW
jgi:polysaccharide biosynthesis/export protein